MSSTIAKGVSLGVDGAVTPGSQYSFIYPGVVNHFTDTGSLWVKLWADLPTLFPSSGSINTTAMNLLAEQVFWAKYFGRGVILTMNYYPEWMNSLVPGSTNGFQQGGKPATARVPDDVSTSSTWAYMVTILLSWFSAGSTRTSIPTQWRAGTIDVLEITNEPNVLNWPQTDTNRSRWLGCHVGQMFQTALTANSWFGSQTAIAGPALSDGYISTPDGLPDAATATNNIMATDASWFASDMIAAMSGTNYVPGPRAIFTMHNYTDVGYQATNMHVANIREQQMRGRWAGWPNSDVNDPHIWITEGGVTMHRLAQLGYTGSAALSAQALFINNAFNKMRNSSTDQNTGGYGIDMVMHYLFESDPGFDSGLIDAVQNGGAQRPAYTTWKNL